MRARLALLLTALVLFARPALAYDTNERITDYKSDVTVAPSGTLTVTETIAVVVADEEIHHGIYRDFPTTYTDKLGRRVRVGFQVLSVKRDGQSEPYDVAGIDAGERIRIGDPDRELDPGTYTYTITYLTTRQIGFFDKYDELYWNVTGNFWKFAIEHAEAVIHLPPGAHITQTSFYTGGEGSTAHDARSELVSDDTVRFETTGQLAANEGLTVAVGFNKGAVYPPTPAQLRTDFLRDNASLITVAMGIFVLLTYFVAAWWEFGRDPARGPIVPLFAPPDGLSPAAVRDIHRMAYDRKAYAASLIDMAVKGYLTIGQEDGAYVLTRTGKSEGESGLAQAETQLASKLFDGDMSVTMKQTNHTQIAASIGALKTALKHECEAKYFVTNLHWFVGGVAILVLTSIVAALQSEDIGVSAGVMFWLGGWSVGTAFIVHQAYDQWLSVGGPGSRILNTLSALFYTAFALPFVGGWFFGLYMLNLGLSPIAGLLLMAGGVATYVFYHLLKAPTALGAKTRDAIDGFALFLNMTEKDRLEVLNPPNLTPALFEKFLPYAIALDCENRWSKRFEAEAARAGQASGSSGTGGYAPLWWSGGSYGNFGAAGFVSGLGASLAASAASASTAPGSSSGSGGGGFSGGGGGGGGGGGW
ncbi:MAG: DUF2207 domain-containing protein [Rhizomicrobium sp.]